MTKVKVISGRDLEHFEFVVNEFIKDKKVVDIKYQPVIEKTPVKGLVYNRALVIYEE